MPVLENGIWDDELAESTHQSSPKLATFLKEYLDKDKPVIDFGCGNGFYCSELEKVGFNCIGIDGYPLKNHLNKNFKVHDLTKPLEIRSHVKLVTGNVLSLEVGEHLPKSAEQTFLDTITKHCSGKLILSWALPSQAGIGHINLQPQDYIIAEIEKRGFALNELATLEGRENVDENCSWFFKTLLIFDKV